MTDHRLKMNFELTGFLMGDIESAVQVNYIYKDANRATCNYYNKRKDEVHGTFAVLFFNGAEGTPGGDGHICGRSEGMISAIDLSAVLLPPEYQTIR